MAREVHSVEAKLKGAWTWPQLSWRPALLRCSSDRAHGLSQNVASGPMGVGGLGRGWLGPERLIGALRALAEMAEVMVPPPLLTVFNFLTAVVVPTTDRTKPVWKC